MIAAVVLDVGETLVNESRLWRLWADYLGVSDHVLFALLGAMIDRGEDHRRVFEIPRPGFDLEAARSDRRATGTPDLVEPADLYPDVADCLNTLHHQGLRLAIAGNQPADVEPVLKRLGLPVDFVASSERWKIEKPSPAFFDRIAAELGAAPASIAYVGDRLDNDILPARAAGMIAVFIRRGPWGFIHALRPEASKADLTIDNLAALPPALARLKT